MSKSRKQLYNITATAIMMALSIVLTRFLPKIYTDTMRVTFGNIPIILLGFLVSPFYGGICGAASDLLGCILFPQQINPWILAANLLLGFLPAFLYSVFSAKLRKQKHFVAFVIIGSIIISHILASVFLKSYGIGKMYGPSVLAQIYLRIPTCTISMIIDSASVYLLYNRLSKISIFKKGKNN